MDSLRGLDNFTDGEALIKCWSSGTWRQRRGSGCGGIGRGIKRGTPGGMKRVYKASGRDDAWNSQPQSDAVHIA